MRHLAIGDIHGCLTAFKAILEKISLHTDDVVVTLGDYVNKGPDSSGVISQLLRLKKKCNLITLRGNHEQMMLEARNSPVKFDEWFQCGGNTTLLSYRHDSDAGKLDDIPRAHWKFIEEACVDYHETRTHFFVHANAYPDLPLAQQPAYMLRWEKIYNSAPHKSKKIMVCGHTSQKTGKILDLGHAICIDTHPSGGGWLTCLDVNSRHYWQTNEAGESRTGAL
jgi:serine/threonine protein phosphatase 1